METVVFAEPDDYHALARFRTFSRSAPACARLDPTVDSA
jgi:hypothetical protein